VFILLFVLAYGVFWEILEFAIGQTAAAFGVGSVLTQYGLEDSLKDLVFNTLGAVVVTLWGTAHLNDVSGYIRERLDQRAA
jgi:VanZ family protein